MVIHSDKFSDKVPESNMEKIFPSQSEVFKDILEEIGPIPRNMHAETLKQRSDERNRTDQKNRELEEWLGIALQAIKRLEARVQGDEMGKVREERKKPDLDEDFFPQWKPQQGIVEEAVEEEEYLSVGEDGRPYIALRKKQEIRREE